MVKLIIHGILENHNRSFMKISKNLGQYDLVSKISKYLDPHMTINILDFLSEVRNKNLRIYSTKSLLAAKYQLLDRTYMVDYRNEVYRELHDLGENENEPGYAENREKIVDKYSRATLSANEISNLISDPKAASRLENDLESTPGEQGKDPPIVRTKDEALCMLYDFATTAYNVGNFDSCHEVLTILQKAAPDGWKYMMSCIWGKMACEILMGRSETALEQFNFLKEKIEQNASLSHAEALVQRIWLLHWSLFVLFDQGRASCEGVIDLFLHHQYFNTISISCVWLLRYLAIAIIINKRRRSHIKDFVNIIQNENIITEDPFVLLIKDLCIDYDFDAARAHFSICKELIYIDFFTQRFAEEFIESARILISETYFRAHHRIYIPDLCDKLDMSHDEGEVWIADIINNTHYDADIDAITNTAVLNIQRRNVYQQVLEVTKGLVIRISSLASTLDKREQDLVEKYKTMYTGDYRSASLSK